MLAGSNNKMYEYKFDKSTQSKTSIGQHIFFDFRKLIGKIERGALKMWTSQRGIPFQYARFYNNITQLETYNALPVARSRVCTLRTHRTQWNCSSRLCCLYIIVMWKSVQFISQILNITPDTAKYISPHNLISYQMTNTWIKWQTSFFRWIKCNWLMDRVALILMIQQTVNTNIGWLDILIWIQMFFGFTLLLESYFRIWKTHANITLLVIVYQTFKCSWILSRLRKQHLWRPKFPVYKSKKQQILVWMCALKFLAIVFTQMRNTGNKYYYTNSQNSRMWILVLNK